MSKRLNPWQIQGYKAGQNVICKVANSEPGGYAVVIVKDNLPGFLPTQAILRTGEDVLAQFVCVHNNRILLSARFSNNIAKSPSSHDKIRWEDQLDQINDAGGPPTTGSGQQDQVYAEPPPHADPIEQHYMASQSRAEQAQQPAPTPAPAPVSQGKAIPPHLQPPVLHIPTPSAQELNQQQQQEAPAPDPYNKKFSYKTSETPAPSISQALGQPTSNKEPISLGFPEQTEEEAAFAAWAPATTPTKKFHLKRATDLILPPMEDDTPEKFTIAENDLEWLITIIEGGMVTGCVKASSEERLSRAAMLLYRGRAVGCIYGCKSMPETQPTEQSLQQMLTDLELASTSVVKYDLPEDVTLAMSALFLGYPVQRNDDYDARSYMDYICNWFEGKSQTACLAITLPSNAATCLGFIYKGQFCGAFYVEDQKFTKDREFVYNLLKNDPKAHVEASILPPEMTSSAVRFGFSLSMARQRRLE